MRIDVKNDNQNWFNFGTLVQQWIDNAASRPTTVGALREQLKKASVAATVEGSDDRSVRIASYPDDPAQALMLMIPAATTRDAKLGQVHAGPYTFMPLFYDIAFGGAPRVNLSAQEAHDFAIRRIGEYSVAECC